MWLRGQPLYPLALLGEERHCLLVSSQGPALARIPPGLLLVSGQCLWGGLVAHLWPAPSPKIPPGHPLWLHPREFRLRADLRLLPWQCL